MPAGLYHTVLASSAAAPPEKAFPVPLPLCVPIAKPPASGCADTPSSAAAAALATIDCFMIAPPAMVRRPESCSDLLVGASTPDESSPRCLRHGARTPLVVHGNIGQ